MLRVSAYSSRELLAVLRGLRALDRETKKHLRQSLRPMVQQAWKQALVPETRLQAAVLVNTARVAVSDQNVRLKSATLTRSLSGGLRPSEGWAPVEFGTYSPRYRGTFGPYERRGKVVYPAAARVIPRILAMWVQTYVRAIHEALEGKNT